MISRKRSALLGLLFAFDFVGAAAEFGIGCHGQQPFVDRHQIQITEGK